MYPCMNAFRKSGQMLSAMALGNSAMMRWASFESLNKLLIRSCWSWVNGSLPRRDRSSRTFVLHVEKWSRQWQDRWNHPGFEPSRALPKPFQLACAGEKIAEKAAELKISPQPSPMKRTQ